jgi:hypothetical protein
MTQRAIAYWVIPPAQDAEFVAAMEALLDVYARPYEAAHPVLSAPRRTGPKQWLACWKGVMRSARS